MLEIFTDKPKAFNEYLVKKIKADLARSAFFFNPEFLFRGGRYTLRQCIDSLHVSGHHICFAMPYHVKHLIYNNRQFFWKEAMEHYALLLDREYMIWRGA